MPKQNMWAQYAPGQARSQLPPGYLHAATEPGRHYANAISSIGQSVGQGLREMGQRQREDQKEREQEAKQMAKERSAYESVIKVRRPDVDPVEMQLMNHNQIRALAQQVELQDTLERQTKQDQMAREEFDLRSLATKIRALGELDQQNMAEHKSTALADYLQWNAAPQYVRRPQAQVIGDLAQENPYAAGELAKLLPQPAKGWNLQPGAVVKFPDGRTARANTPNSVQLDPPENLDPDKVTTEKLEDGTVVLYRNGKAWKTIDPDNLSPLELMLMKDLGMSLPTGGGTPANSGNDPLGIR